MPILAKMARDYSSVMATSMPSESIFSHAGLVITKLCNRLVPKAISLMMSLKSWSLLDDHLMDAAEILDGTGDTYVEKEEEDTVNITLDSDSYDMTPKGGIDLIIV